MKESKESNEKSIKAKVNYDMQERFLKNQLKEEGFKYGELEHENKLLREKIQQMGTNI